MTKHGSGAPRARKGETLAEVLVSLLIVVLSTLLLASMVTASAGVNFTARQKDEKFYEALSEVEGMHSDKKLDPSPGTHEATIVDSEDNKTEISVDVFTSENLAIYREKVGP